MRALGEPAKRNVIDVGGEKRVEVDGLSDFTCIGGEGGFHSVEIRDETFVGIAGFDAGRGPEDVGDFMREHAIPAEVVGHEARLRRDQHGRGAGAEHWFLRSCDPDQRMVAVDHQRLATRIQA